MEIRTNSPQETRQVAQEFAKTLKGGEVIALFGALGAGKTTFLQGLAKGLGIKRRILSPTFIFLRSYLAKIGNKRINFHHIDLYRLEAEEDLKFIDLNELMSKDAIIALEWAEKVENLLPKKRTDVLIEAENETKRKIKISRHG